jgi:hypothetical protein
MCYVGGYVEKIKSKLVCRLINKKVVHNVAEKCDAMRNFHFQLLRAQGNL